MEPHLSSDARFLVVDLSSLRVLAEDPSPELGEHPNEETTLWAQRDMEVPKHFRMIAFNDETRLSLRVSL